MVRVLKMPHQESYDESDHREALTAIEPYRNHVLIGIPILISWSHTCSSACSAPFDGVIALRVEGVSISAISRIKGIAWNTVARWLEKAAQVCRRWWFRH